MSRIETAPRVNGQRIAVVDALRGVAAAWVVLFHLNEVRPDADVWWQSFCSHGWLGVPVFFVISGFCLASIAVNETHVSAFLVGRFARIFPPYWASLLLVIGVAVMRWVWTGTNDVARLPMDVSPILATLTLATAPATSAATVNWVYWTLTCEVAFYLVVALGVAMHRPASVVLFITILALTWRLLDPSTSGLLFFLPQFPLFALGWAIRDSNRGKWAWAFAALALVAIGSLLSVQQLVAAMATAACLRLRATARPFRVVACLGAFSYSLYLVHVPLGCHLLARLRPLFSGSSPAADIVFDLTVLAGLMGAAWIAYRTVEAPAQDWGRRIACSLRSTRTPVSPALIKS